MTAKKLRLLAECIEQGSIPEDDRKGWASDLRGLANGIEVSVLWSGLIQNHVAVVEKEHANV